MSDRPQTQPPRDQGTKSSMSASGDDRQSTLRPRQPPSDASDSPKSKFDTQELLANTHPCKNTLIKERTRTNNTFTTLVRKLMPKNMPGGREQHALGSGTQENPAATLGDNELVGQGLSDLSDGKKTLSKKGHVSNNTSIASVQRGKQKVSQGVGASTAKPNAGTPDSRNNLYKRAIQ